ncbi:hypothetical protein Tco_0863478 [Tanacetum coccineum]
MVMEESKSNSNAKIRLLGSLVASSKQKPLKKFAYTNEQGETFQMTKEEIKNQKGIEQAVKADVAKSKIKKIKQNMIDLIGLEVVQRMYRDKASNLHLEEWKEAMQAYPNRTGFGWTTIYTQMKQRLDALHKTKEELEVDVCFTS